MNPIHFLISYFSVHFNMAQANIVCFIHICTQFCQPRYLVLSYVFSMASQKETQALINVFCGHDSLTPSFPQCLGLTNRGVYRNAAQALSSSRVEELKLTS
jgi:hypothetical protein